MTAPYQAPAPGYGGPPPQRPKRNRGGTIMVLVLVGVILLCLGLGTASYVFVVRVDPGGGTPAAGADSLLTAVFDKKDPDAVSRYLCAKLRDGRSSADLVERGGRYQGASWDTPRQLSRSGENAKVGARLRFRLSSTGTDYSYQRWEFTMVDEDGWRVCGVHTGK
ncbi:MAG: hypothetical protein WCA46_06315 [Actinocatenispora sp.]